MAEVLLDTKFWNKVFKLLPPAVVVAVKTNKGSGKDKLIPSNGLQVLDSSNNENGFFLKFLDQYYGKRWASRHGQRERLIMLQGDVYKKGVLTPMLRQIERAILQIAIADGLIPETAKHDEELVIEKREAVFESTAGFGFVYFVRNEDIYKIGITENLLRQMKELNPDEILNSVRCNNYQEIEKSMHAHFKNRRIPQTEYFRLDAAEVEEAHALMTKMANF